MSSASYEERSEPEDDEGSYDQRIDEPDESANYDSEQDEPEENEPEYGYGSEDEAEILAGRRVVTVGSDNEDSSESSERAIITKRKVPPTPPIKKPRKILGSPSSRGTTAPLKKILAPVVYDYPGDQDETRVLLEDIESEVEYLYPGEQNNHIVARCVLYNLTFNSYYSLPMQEKVSRVTESLYK